MENIEMEVDIAGERVKLTVPFSRQDAVRETESSLKELARDLRKRNPRSGDKQILAKLAYEFARRYNALKAKRYAELAEAEQFLLETEKLCHPEIPEE